MTTNTPDTKKRTGRSYRVVWVLLAVIVLIKLALVFLLATTPGTKLTLGVIENVTGVQMQGISGTLLHQLSIKRVAIQRPDLELIADDVELQWQPSALFSRHIQLDYLRIDRLQVATAPGDDQPLTLPSSLALPGMIQLISADQLAVGQLDIATLKDKQYRDPLSFSSLAAQVSIDATCYQLQLSGQTPWGSATIKGEFGPLAPFATQAQFDWQGLASDQHGVAIPATQAIGSVTGDWKRLQVQAQVDTAVENKKNTDAVDGYVNVVLTPFNKLPIEALQLDIDSVDPSSFYIDAPKGDLQLKANFKVIEQDHTPTLQGQLSAINTDPMPWNVGGIPVVELRSELTVNEHQLNWQAMKLALEEGGVAKGSGQIIFATSTEKTWPEIITDMDINNVNLLRIDSRLKKTKLTGVVQANSVEEGVQFALNLEDTSDKNLNARLNAEIDLTHDDIIHLKKVELRAKETKLNAQGHMALRDKQEFSLTIDARDFNPSHWIDVPEGRIATKVNVIGKLQPAWHVDAKVTELSGYFAGLNLQGSSDVVAQQDKLLSIKKLDVDWGKNHLSASGDWKLGDGSSSVSSDKLQFKVALPDLSTLNAPFKKILADARKEVEHESAQGAIFIDGVLSGNIKQPAGQLNIKADNVAIPGVLAFDKLQTNLTLDAGAQGKVDGRIDASGVVLGTSSAENGGVVFNQLDATLSGQRQQHQLQVNAVLPRKYRMQLQATGDLKSRRDGNMQWQGKLEQLNISGASDLQLISPVNVQISSNAARMEEANWQGKLGKLQIQQMDWTRGQLKTKGQIQNLAVVDALRLARFRLPLLGDLQIDAGWDFVINPKRVSGSYEFRRTSGDLVIQDVTAGYSQTFALGLQNAMLTGSVGQRGAGREPMELRLQITGSQLGQIEANLRSSASGAESAPLSGSAKMQINDIQWLSQLIAPGVSLRGQLQAQAQIAGTIGKPSYNVAINGKELQVAMTELGVLLPNGILEASIESNPKEMELKLTKLQFSQTIHRPKLATSDASRNRFFTEPTWINEKGVAEASGEIDLRSGRGSINASWQRFPFLQTDQAWLVASGDAQLTETTNAWKLVGQMVADAAYFSVPRQPAPRLSSDVVVLKKNDKRDEASGAGVQSNVDFNVKTGDNFIFVGRGLNTRLAGDLRLRVQNSGPVLATGSIQATAGTYEGYGQQLAIERGILNFQGPIDNPTLNVRALRRGLPVEAGVEVIGSVAKPEVRLISEPNVPDQDKLSWMILGHGSDQTGGSEVGLLMTAAGAIFGGDSGKSIPGQIAQTFGLDDISVSSTSGSPESQLPAQTVAGSITNGGSTDQVVSVGKRVTPDLVFSIERSLIEATNGVKLTWNLTRRFSVIGRAGSDMSIDGQYLFSFN